MTKQPHSSVADDDFAQLITKYGAEEDMANAILVVEVPTSQEDGKHQKTDDESNDMHSKEIEIPVIKEFLMASSPVFRTMFRSGFKESETKRVNLKGKSVEQVLNMLDYMYPEKTQILTDSMAASLLPIAHEYEISRLQSLCVQKLGEMRSPRLEYLTLAIRFDLPDLLEKSVNACAERLSLDNIELEEVLKVNQDLPEKYVNQLIRKKLRSSKQQISNVADKLHSYTKGEFGRSYKRNYREQIELEKNRVTLMDSAAVDVRNELRTLVHNM